MTATRTVWAGRIMSALAVAFLAFDGSLKLMNLPMVLEATAQLGFPPSGVVRIGLVLLACTAVYAVPRTAPIGAVLLTGYLGGAVAAHVRVGNPLFETFFPVLVGSFIWTGLLLRDERVRALLIDRALPRADRRAVAA